MRRAFAHEAVLAMGVDADTGAPGAAIPAALCGHWEHPPPCPLAAHHIRATRSAADVHIHTLFVAEPDAEGGVRQLIDSALSGGQLAGPDGTTVRWRLLGSQHRDVTAEESEHAQRLAR